MARRTRLTPVYIKNKRELAEKIGVSPTMLYWLFKQQGCPSPTDEGYELTEMIMFAKANMKREIEKGGVSDAVSARMKLTLVQIEKIELQNQKARGMFLDREVWKKQFGGLVAEMNASFSRLFMQELPLQFEGKSAIEIREGLKNAYNRVRDEFFEKGMAIKAKEDA